jgi:hypothetical protein
MMSCVENRVVLVNGCAAAVMMNALRKTISHVPAGCYSAIAVLCKLHFFGCLLNTPGSDHLLTVRTAMARVIPAFGCECKGATLHESHGWRQGSLICRSKAAEVES